MKYLVIHQNPIHGVSIRTDAIGDIVVFTVPDDFTLYEYPNTPEEQSHYQIHHPEFDLKKIITDVSLLNYMDSIRFPYDTEFELCDTRWAEYDNVYVFNSFMEMYDHIYVCRQYTVIHHRYHDIPYLEYMYQNQFLNNMKERDTPPPRHLSFSQLGNDL